VQVDGDAPAMAPVVKEAGVEKLPTVVVYLDGTIFHHVVGADPQSIVASIEEASNAVEKGKSRLDKKLKGLIDSADVVLFMKGTKSEPFCRFSRAAVNLLNGLDAQYSTFNILEDNEVREGMKVFSDFPTFPQLYIKGEFIGGVDIMTAEAQTGTLQAMLMGDAV